MNCLQLQKTKESQIIDFCFSRDGIICIKNIDSSKPEKIHHIKELWDLFPDFVFSNDEENIPHAEHDVANVCSNSATV